MKRFQFGLESTLEWKDRQSDLQRQELERLQSALIRLQQDRQSIDRQVCDTTAALDSGATLSAADLQLTASFTRSLRCLGDKLAVEEQKCDALINRQRDVCIEADREHQLLCRLRSKKLAGWKYQFNRELEELATDSWMAAQARK